MSVGEAAAGEREEIEVLGVDDGDLDSEESEHLLRHSFRLRKELTLDFDLPADLTEAEADRLAAFVRSLPFGHP